MNALWPQIQSTRFSETIPHHAATIPRVYIVTSLTLMPPVLSVSFDLFTLLLILPTHVLKIFVSILELQHKIQNR